MYPSLQCIYQPVPPPPPPPPPHICETSTSLFILLIGSGVFDTVLLAIGRDPVTANLNLASVGVETTRDGKIKVFREQTTAADIYALGDVASVAGVDAPLELTPVAIQAGRLLARRLYASSRTQMNYNLVPTTIFTPIEYGCVGWTEEEAYEKLGQASPLAHMS